MIRAVPIQVDRDAQRQHVTDIAAQLVADEGVSALTFRRVADAAGSSTAIVSTYFSDKLDLLAATLGAAATRTSVRFEAATRRRTAEVTGGVATVGRGAT
jgi:AcrR family transcriptional regulator